MSLDKKTVAKIGNLAAIAFAEDELDRLTGELNPILDWIEQLSELDTEGVPPMTGAVQIPLKQREDVVQDGDCRDKILGNAPETIEGFFVVPKIVDGNG